MLGLLCFSRSSQCVRLPLLLLAALLAASCATVRPEQKEYLAEPSMIWTNSSMVARHEAHVIDNREGSTGGSKTKGGGCGCN